MAESVPTASRPVILVPPEYCQYADGGCDQDFPADVEGGVFFIYPSEPAQIAATIESAVSTPRRLFQDQPWSSWKSLPITGQIIFCEICKAMRTASTLVADVTTLNFNVLFEVGYALGLGLAVIPIRDTSYQLDKRAFDELGIFDVIGYIDFANANQLIEAINARLPVKPLALPKPRLHMDSPIYVLKGPIDTEGAIRLLASLKKSALRFRTYDQVETPRLSLLEASRQVTASLAVVSHLLSPNRPAARVHNALCAFISGLAMAQGRVVLMLQEEVIKQPIDYRDVVQSYTTPDQIPRMLESTIKRVVEHLQREAPARVAPNRESLLQRLDLGDIAAENEIQALDTYFVQTGQFIQARQGHARLVVGRKGSGKTALFYQIRNSVRRGRDRLVLDLKPEGHQFVKLREAVLSRLSPGLQEHMMVAFWNFILVAEIARRIVEHERQYAEMDPDRHERYQAVCNLYRDLDPGREADFSQRLLGEVDRIVADTGQHDLLEIGGRLTEIIYGGDLNALNDAVSEYLEEKDLVWLLIDNLDKGWPTHGTTKTDMIIVRALLEATRKLERQMEDRSVELRCLVFLRSDIYEHLLQETPDKGKETPIRLDWEDPVLFEQIVAKRIETSTGEHGEFRQVWRTLCESHIGTIDSFDYMLARTLMRPRDILQFLRRAVELSINRAHAIVTATDIGDAEKSFSEDLLLTTSFEIADSFPDCKDVLFSFQSSKRLLSRDEVEAKLVKAGITKARVPEVIRMLVWFCFLGVAGFASDEERFAYGVNHDVRRLLHPVQADEALFVIHRAFCSALETRD